jgi:hypothetical protein
LAAQDLRFPLNAGHRGTVGGALTPNEPIHALAGFTLSDQNDLKKPLSREELLSSLQPEAGVLDLGCGAGTFRYADFPSPNCAARQGGSISAGEESSAVDGENSGGGRD